MTDGIETFTESGLKLASGAELEADVIVTATGLNLQLLGGMEVGVDGRDVAMSETVGYKGMMFSGLPNMAVTLGYTNASWTLKADLCAEYVCRLLNHMDANGYRVVTPLGAGSVVSRRSRSSTSSPATCCARSTLLPRQGERTPWRLHQNYARDILLMRRGPIEDEAIAFSRDGVAAPGAQPAEPVAV